jgi:hypothetical protein
MKSAQVAAVAEVVALLGNIIRQVKEIPSGHLYARLMDKVNLDQYNSLIAILQRMGWIKIQHHLIIWTGPND